MRRTAVFVTAATAVLFATTAVAQDKPNFAGSWTQVVDPNAPAPTGRGGGRGGLGASPTIVMDAKTLTITRTTQAGEVKSVYNLDGSDSKNTMSMGGTSIEQVSKAKWDGAKLVITTSMNFNGNPIETSMTLSMDAGNLIVESTSPGRGGGAATTSKTTYKKS